MKIGLVGYQGTGKSVAFELLTGNKPDLSKVQQGQSGVAILPDPRFDGLVKMFNPKKQSPAKFELFDTPGLFRDPGANNSGRQAIMREAAALVHVIGSYSGADAVADARQLEEDMLLADLQVVTNRIERLKASIGKNRPDKEECQLELACLLPIEAALNDGKKLRDVPFTDDQEKYTKSFSFLSRKKQILLLNTADASVDKGVVETLEKAGYLVVSAPLGIELELSALSPEEREIFAAEYGITESSRERLLKAIFKVADLITFFTSDEKEVHAWLLKRNSTALEAAHSIHSDLARGFIRAELMSVDDLLRLGSEREVKAQNLYHLVGKEHIVKDGDEIIIRSGV
jgi:ribosome-binding ATPase YchF (GTP1/OBG family)